MKRPSPPWSWTALAVSVVPTGAVMVIGMFLVGSFREGLDADMLPMMSQMGAIDLLGAVAMMGAAGSVFLLLGWWVARLTSRGARTFVAVSAGVPTLLQASQKAWYIAQSALEGPTGLMPWPGDSLLYLPNWLELVLTASALSAGAATYLLIARAAKD